jgi:Mg2+/Co2+ transporter CorB
VSDISIGALFGWLVVFLVFAACFSGSETSMMALNRYRLRHLAHRRHGGAVRASRLLERPDRLIGLILLGQNLVNNLAAAITTVIAIRLFDEGGIAMASMLLTIVMLIFTDVLPKTVAALHPERLAFPAAYVLEPLLRLMYPVVWLVNTVANGVLRIFGLNPDDYEEMPLSREELRTVVMEAGAIIPRRHQHMLFAILDLEKVTVEDIMVPRGEIVGINLDAGSGDLEEQLLNCRHTRLPVYRGNIDQVKGMLHVRNALRLLADEEFTAEAIAALAEEPYYVPIGTPLHVQLRNFQRQRRRMGLVVNEYGDIEGLVTLDDLLEEIVGEFTTHTQSLTRDIHPQEDGSFLIDASTTIREINRATALQLPSDGPKTLNGLILEALESIPESGTSLRIGNHTVEIVQTTGQSVKTVRIMPTRDASALKSADDALPPAQGIP